MKSDLGSVYVTARTKAICTVLPKEDLKFHEVLCERRLAFRGTDETVGSPVKRKLFGTVGASCNCRSILLPTHQDACELWKRAHYLLIKGHFRRGSQNIEKSS